jgi:hypothetical protein
MINIDILPVAVEYTKITILSYKIISLAILTFFFLFRIYHVHISDSSSPDLCAALDRNINKYGYFMTRTIAKGKFAYYGGPFIICDRRYGLVIGYAHRDYYSLLKRIDVITTYDMLGLGSKILMLIK